MPGLYQTFKSALTDVDIIQSNGTPVDPLGQLRIDGQRMYKYVKFSGTTTVAAGDVVCYVAADATANIVDGANTALGAGIAMAAVASGTVQYGWIQVKGIATLSTALAGTPAVGDTLTNNGATAPALTKNAGYNTQAVAVTVIVASKVVLLDFSF